MPGMTRPLSAAILILVVVWLLFASLVYLGVFDTFELLGYDLLAYTAGFSPPSENVVLVEFDNASIAAIGKYPVPREVLARVVTRIGEGEPAVIGLDKLLGDAGTPEADEELAAALDGAGNVVLADVFGTAQIPANEPMPIFRNRKSVGFVNLVADPDGFVRRMLVYVKTGNFSGVSFPVALVSNFTGQPLLQGPDGNFRIGSLSIPLDGTGRNTALPGAWNPHPAERTVPVKELLSPAFDASAFRGKIVIVGESSSEGKDLYTTPVFRFRAAGPGRKLLSGAEAHAVAVDSILTGRMIRVAPRWSQWVAGLVFVALAFALVIFPERMFGILSAVFLGGGVFFLALFLFTRHNLWLPFFASEAGIVLSLVGGLAYRFVEERSLKSAAETAKQQEARERQALESEMARAREIQQGLLPAALPEIQGIEIAARYEPSLLVGGDYYDFLRPSPSSLLFAVADVQGHGVDAALIMSNLQASLHSLLRKPEAIPPAELASALNVALVESAGGRRLVTLFLGFLDLESRELRYVNAGHVPPLLFRPGRESPARLEEGGIPLGAFSDSKYESASVQLGKGDVLLALTDGIPEASNAAGERFQLQGVSRTAGRLLERRAREIVDAVFRDSEEFAGGGTHEDDKICLVLKFL
jgi:serine phosphatase RsbU (regulator of sigma subunit)